MKRIPKPETWKYMPLFEKIAYYKQFIGKEHVHFVDKLAVKDYIASLNANVKTSKVVRILQDAKDLHETDVGKSYILKATHGSGWNISLQDKHPSDIPAITAQLQTWNRTYAELKVATTLWVVVKLSISGDPAILEIAL